VTTRRYRVGALLAASAAAATLSGCGLSNPYAPTATSTRPSATTSSRPSSAPARTFSPALRTPAAVLAAQRNAVVRVAVDYALTQATWSPGTYIAQLAHLATLAVGPAAAQLTPTRAPAATVNALRAAGASSRAVLLASDGPTPGPAPTVVVITRVSATGAGRNPNVPDYQVCHLTLTHTPAGWRVAQFAIQP